MSEAVVTAEAKCPECGGLIVPIVYGLPSVELWESAERAEVVLGGCTIFPGQPTHTCQCGHSTRGESDDDFDRVSLPRRHPLGVAR